VLLALISWAHARTGTDPGLTRTVHEVGETLLGNLHFPGPQVEFSRTPPSWPEPALVPRGSSQPEWL